MKRKKKNMKQMTDQVKWVHREQRFSQLFDHVRKVRKKSELRIIMTSVLLNSKRCEQAGCVVLIFTDAMISFELNR